MINILTLPDEHFEILMEVLGMLSVDDIPVIEKLLEV